MTGTGTKLTSVFGLAWDPPLDKLEAEGAALDVCLTSYPYTCVLKLSEDRAPAVPKECGFTERTDENRDTRFLQ